ncbi:N-acyl amino acid synthase FeeM domain-containing protein [Wenxinia marina]|uniref:N-acyl-L-homoserine lactone synthetase n=1 Tax=Wenxinia marina DSM 24838 TaxID=1123501 RepID=A0A0D0QBG0_9RHOB|nr:hypothetical protein [Wenxinia marina]KIQ68258.1 N-acyl-L-homoserine lactone synthetase [Wenxinia marina DSM 24838]GGL77177.1 hypothetical protein GCM10011392_34530 [Wenxinia marina]
MNEQVLAALRACRYRIVSDEAGLEEIRRLRYKGYLAERSIDPDESGIMSDAFDDMDNCVNVAVDLDGTLCAAVRLHLVTKDFPHSPTLTVFPEAGIEAEHGQTILDPTRFVVDPDARLQGVPLHFLALRIPMLATIFYDVDIALAPVRKEHVAFYSRYLRYTPMIGPRSYLGLKKPLQLLRADVKDQRTAVLARMPALGPVSEIPQAAIPFPGLWNVRSKSKSDAA